LDPRRSRRTPSQSPQRAHLGSNDRSRQLLFFFFSSRRRHTRFSRDWSSDVCSSDLSTSVFWWGTPCSTRIQKYWESPATIIRIRSEERRVGKECRSRGSPEHEKQKER